MSEYAQRYLQGSPKVGVADPIFWILVRPNAHGYRPATRSLQQGTCLLIFTSPFKANEYVANAADLQDSVRMVAWSAARCASELPGLRAQGIPLLRVDPIGCGDVWATVRNETSIDSIKLLEMWRIMRATSLKVGQTHYDRLLTAVRAADFAHAAPDLEDLIGCVIPEEPRASILLGACAVALDDRAMLEHAMRNLQILDPACAEGMQAQASSAIGRDAATRRRAANRITSFVKDVRHPLLKP